MIIDVWREVDGKGRRDRMNLCSGRAHLNSPGRLVYICLLDKSGLRLADNRSPDQFHYLLEISRHRLVQSRPQSSHPLALGFPVPFDSSWSQAIRPLMPVALSFLFSSSLLVIPLFFGRVSHCHGADCYANDDPGHFSTTWTHQRTVPRRPFHIYRP
jgi:hypothetical protein